MTRCLWRKRIIIDFDSEYNIEKIKEGLRGEKTEYYKIKCFYQKNEHRLIVRCGASDFTNFWRELLNMNIYNKHKI